MGREVFLLGQFLKSRLQEHYTGIEFLYHSSLYHSSFLLALVVSLQAQGFPHRLHSLPVLNVF